MNRIRQWMAKRRLRKESEAAAKKQKAEALKKAEAEAQNQKRLELKGHVIAVSESLEKIGFKTNDKYATGDESSQATLVAVGPDQHVYILTVFQPGGYNLKRP